MSEEHMRIGMTSLSSKTDTKWTNVGQKQKNNGNRILGTKFLKEGEI